MIYYVFNCVKMKMSMINISYTFLGRLWYICFVHLYYIVDKIQNGCYKIK